MPICTTCSNWYVLRSRIPQLCRDCEAQEIQRAAREPDPRAMSISALAAWVQTGQPPLMRTPVWEVK